MDRGTKFLERLAEDTNLTDVPVPGQPIVEIAGTHRVLIENHLGICGYSREKIVVKVRFGAVVVCGQGLELLKMRKGQLVIRGQVDGVALQRRG